MAEVEGVSRSDERLCLCAGGGWGSPREGEKEKCGRARGNFDRSMPSRERHSVEGEFASLCFFF